MSLSKEKLLELSKLYTIKEMANILSTPYSTIWYNLKKHNIKSVCDTNNEKHYDLFNIYTPESCYWAGFIAADGSIHINPNKGNYRISIHLGYDDINHLKKFKNVIGCDNKISGSKSEGCYIQVSSKQTVRVLKEKFNIIPRKSLILEPPPNDIPNCLIKHYVRGCFDGDGHTNYNNNSISCNFNLVSASKNFINWVVYQLKIFKNDISIYNKDGVFCVDLNNQISFNILSWLYDESTENTRLDRKYEYCLKSFKNVEKVKQHYESLGKRCPPGCKGFDLGYESIAQEYLAGNKLKDLSSKYNVSYWTLLARFKKLGIRKNNRKHGA